MKSRNKIFVTILTFFLFGANIINAQETVKIYADKKMSSVTYEMSHPLHDWKGVNKNVKAVIKRDKETEKDLKVAVALKISDFDSKNANRDSHAIEVLDALKYPAVTFVSSEIIENDGKSEVTGDLTFHNVKKRITVPVIVKRKNGKTFYSGMFDVDMTEYGIKRPSLTGIPTDKIIKISFFIVF